MRSVAKLLRRRVFQGAVRGSAGPLRVEPLSDSEAGSFPPADFVSKEFDSETGVAPSRMIVILSTPRSGSTYLCQLLHWAGLCTPHEYFQREQYLPILADRWGSMEAGRVRWDRYVSALERHRTSAAGVLGVNLHGGHLPLFVEALPEFTAKEVQYVWLQRRDKLRQAVSFGIARQTGQWSSEFRAEAEPKYSADYFAKRLKMIHRQEDLIRAFLHLKKVPCEQIFYEDFTPDPAAVLTSVFGASFDAALLSTNRSIQRQGNAVNEDFVRRLASDLLPDASAAKPGGAVTPSLSSK